MAHPKYALNLEEDWVGQGCVWPWAPMGHPGRNTAGELQSGIHNVAAEESNSRVDAYLKQVCEMRRGQGWRLQRSFLASPPPPNHCTLMNPALTVLCESSFRIQSFCECWHSKWGNSKWNSKVVKTHIKFNEKYKAKPVLNFQ
jgi:hypothetical protein